MGFFKNLMNKITGGGAKVSIEFIEPHLRETFKVKIMVTVADTDLKAAKIYLNIRSAEHTTTLSATDPDNDSTSTEEVSSQVETYSTELVVAGGQTLKANETYEWFKEISLPPSAMPTYHGKNVRHEWEFYAGIDVAGNDPDSGWVKVELF